MAGGLGPRVRKLQERLLALRVGPGALKLPKEVSRIHIRFATKMYNGHMGPRKFWRTELPQLKYHNPAVSMTVDRDATNEENPLLTIFFTDPDAKQTSGQKTGGPAATTSTSGDKVASDHAPAERTKSVDMAGKMPYDIVQDIIRLTGATKINPTGEEIQLLRQLKSERERSEADRMKMQAVNDEKKRQAQLLAEARGMTA